MKTGYILNFSAGVNYYGEGSNDRTGRGGVARAAGVEGSVMIGPFTFTVYGLPTLNEYIDAERGHRYKAAKMKKTATENVAWSVQGALREVPHGLINCRFHFEYVEPTRRRDKDNIDFQRKFIFDGLVMVGVMNNDGWGQISGWDEPVFTVKKGCELHVIVTFNGE